MSTPREQAVNSLGLLVLGVLGLGGVWIGARVLGRLLEQLGMTIEQVATATGNAIGNGVGMAYAPMDLPDPTIPADRYDLGDVEGEALHAYDLTYGYINDPEPEGRIAVVPPGGSIIPGDTP
jgi:hypothetical protein